MNRQAINQPVPTAEGIPLSRRNQGLPVIWKPPPTDPTGTAENRLRPVTTETMVNTETSIWHGNAIAKPSKPHSQIRLQHPAKPARDFLH